MMQNVCFQKMARILAVLENLATAAGGTQAVDGGDAVATSDGGTPSLRQSCDFEDVFGDVVADRPVFAEHLHTFFHAVDGLFAAFAAGQDVGQ